ncbi:hypothetical protein [Nocardioides sp. MH1]|uniref:hypothetical protein n=1 Tax=Nocardioides sp. MH1 TaxID=3242490 RepID=UPI003520E3C3
MLPTVATVVMEEWRQASCKELHCSRRSADVAADDVAVDGWPGTVTAVSNLCNDPTADSTYCFEVGVALGAASLDDAFGELHDLLASLGVEFDIIDGGPADECVAGTP